MKSRFSISIVGGGLTGLTLAALLAKGRQSDALDITVVDAASRPVFSQDDDVSLRVSAIANGSAELLDSLGAWDAVKNARVSPYESMRVWDENDTPDGASTLEFKASEFAAQQLGFIVENVLLQSALLGVLKDTETNLQYETKLESLPEADLVVGYNHLYFDYP